MLEQLLVLQRVKILQVVLEQEAGKRKMGIYTDIVGKWLVVERSKQESIPSSGAV